MTDFILQSILLFLQCVFIYLILEKFTKKKFLGGVCALIYATMPFNFYFLQHGGTNGYLSLGLLIVIYFFGQKLTDKILKIILISCVLLILGSVFFPPDFIADWVNQKRAVSNSFGFNNSQYFSNKFVESVRLREQIFFENTDLNNLFFKGHPRERLGISEINKIYFVFIPLIILGLFKIDKRLLNILGIFGSIGVVVPVILLDRSSMSNYLLTFPLAVLTGVGVESLFNNKRYRYLLIIVGVVLVMEVCNLT